MDVKRLASTVALAAALVFVAWRTEVAANSSGIFNQAEAGCTCHGTGSPVPSTRIFILGLPDGSDPTKPTGYEPGREYDIQILVVGLSAPPSGAGFDLHPTIETPNAAAGSLVSADSSAKVRHESECTRLYDDGDCGPNSFDKTDATDCAAQVSTSAECAPFDASKPQCVCPGPGTGCRPCNLLPILGIEATHTQPKTLPFTWSFKWTAPPVGSGPVTFHLAANVVNGDGTASSQDLWSKLGADPLQPLITVPEGEKAATVPLPIALPAH